MGWRVVPFLAQDQRVDERSRPGYRQGARLARRAVELGKDDAVALTRAGHALGHFAGDIEGGILLLDRAAMLNPNLAAAWFLGGYLRPGAAIRGRHRAFHPRPAPQPPGPEIYRMQAGMAVAHLFARRFDAAASWAEKSFRELPSFLMVVSILAASQALAGRKEEAERAMAHLRRLDPALRISNLRAWLPIHRPEDLAIFADWLRKAGLPE